MSDAPETTEMTSQEFREWLATQSAIVQFMHRDDSRLRPQSQIEHDRWVIELALDDREKAVRAYGAIAQLLFEMGEIETLRFWRRNRVWVTDAARE
jgi:hypothetical protein